MKIFFLFLITSIACCGYILGEEKVKLNVKNALIWHDENYNSFLEVDGHYYIIDLWIHSEDCPGCSRPMIFTNE